MIKKYILIILFVFCSISFVNAEEEPKKDFVILHQLYSQKKLIVDVDIEINLMMTDEVNVELSSAQTGLIEKRKIKPISYLKPKHRKYQTVFDMKKLSNGVYNIKVVVRDEYGDKLMDESVKEFTWLPKELEKFKWLNSKEGITEEVLAPWIPIEVEKKGKELIVKVWGREYHFENSIFPTKIETKGTSILAGSIQAIAKVNGKNVRWTWNSVKIEKQIPSIIRFTQDALGEGLVLSVTTHIEYDGMIRMDLRLTSKQSLKLEELIFEIPLLAKHAKYIYHSGYTSKVGFIYKDRRIGAFEPVIWFGNEDLGIQWFCESEVDWYTKPTRCIEILPDENIVKLRLHLVDRTISMKPGIKPAYEFGIPVMQPVDNVNELEFTFGLQATPVKPIIKDAWDYRFISVGPGSADTGMTPGTADRFNWTETTLNSLANKTIVYSDFWTDVYSSTSTPYEKELKKLVKDCHDRGMQFLVYIGLAMSDIAPEWLLFNEECVSIPRTAWEEYSNYPPMPSQKPINFCLRSVWQDYLSDGLSKKMMAEYDLDGVYLDSLDVLFGGCKNTLHGCGYIDSNGRLHRTFAIFAKRQTMRRFYTVIKKHKPDGQVNFHNSTCMLVPTMAWATSYWNGEHLGAVMRIQYNGVSKKSPILKKMPLDYFRTEFMGHQWGVPAEFLDYHFTNDLEEAVTLSLLHDVPIRAWYLLDPVWNLMKEFGRKESEWLPYWKNKEYVTIKPEGMDIYASLYKHPKNGVLAVVSNLGETDVKNVIVQLNLEKLKLKDKEKLFAYTMTVTLSDDKQKWLTLTDKKPINITDGSFDISLSSQRWKLIWIKKEK